MSKLLTEWQREQIRATQEKYMSEYVIITRESLDGSDFDPETGEHDAEVTEVWEGHVRMFPTEREPRRAEPAEEQQFIARFIITLPYDAEATVGDKIYFQGSAYPHIVGSTMVITSERPSSYATVRRLFAEWPRSVGGAY